MWIIYEFSGHKVRRLKHNGYFSGKDICDAGEKHLNNYLRSSSTKEFLKGLKEELKEDPLLKIKYHGAAYRGIWLHPRATTHLACWISPKFFIKISEWIEEWKLAAPQNANKYAQELCCIESSKILQKEKEVQERLHKEYGGEIEVKTPVGFIDISNDELIIEIKEFSQWKHALGQILCYSSFYPEKRKMLYLYAAAPDCEDKVITVLEICARYEIEVKIEYTM